jgi:hypothetical protein
MYSKEEIRRRKRAAVKAALGKTGKGQKRNSGKTESPASRKKPGK